MDYTKKNLRQVKDSALEFGVGDMQEARFAGGDLEAKETGFALQYVKPGCNQAFGHRHDRAEEVYVVLSGGGQVKLDDELVDLAAMDALRVGPEIARGFRGGADGLELLVFGPLRKGDGEVIHDFWED